ncbi:MAG: glycosyltransferase family 39 protein [Vicinamibacterales bacterium]
MVFRAAVWLVDAILVGLTVTILGVLLTGGGVFSVGALRVSVRSIDNPLLFWLIVAGLRWWRARSTPFLGVRSLLLADLDVRALRLCRRIADCLSTLTHTRALAIIAGFTILSFALRVINAYVHYGFFAGDDVEIHEMTLAALFHRDWPVWNLRNAFYPMTFIFPAQWIALQCGFTGTGALIFVGRLVVALFSSITCLLLFRVARLYLGVPVALLSVTILAASHLHVNIGSTELPRPVAAFFLVAAFGLSLRRGLFAGAAAGVLLGLAGAMRFGEAVFILPALTILLAEGRRADAIATVVSFGVALLAITGVADLMYWGTPFYSFRNAVDFTLLKGLSTRGYQPFHYYFSHIGEWSNLYVAGLGLGAIWLRYWKPSAWAWLACCPTRKLDTWFRCCLSWPWQQEPSSGRFSMVSDPPIPGVPVGWRWPSSRHR